MTDKGSGWWWRRRRRWWWWWRWSWSWWWWRRQLAWNEHLLYIHTRWPNCCFFSLSTTPVQLGRDPESWPRPGFQVKVLKQIRPISPRCSAKQRLDDGWSFQQAVNMPSGATCEHAKWYFVTTSWAVIANSRMMSFQVIASLVNMTFGCMLHLGWGIPIKPQLQGFPIRWTEQEACFANLSILVAVPNWHGAFTKPIAMPSCSHSGQDCPFCVTWNPIGFWLLARVDGWRKAFCTECFDQWKTDLFWINEKTLISITVSGCKWYSNSGCWIFFKPGQCIFLIQKLNVFAVPSTFCTTSPGRLSEWSRHPGDQPQERPCIEIPHLRSGRLVLGQRAMVRRPDEWPTQLW